jgi:P2 family phage contractile tail tube protein
MWGLLRGANLYVGDDTPEVASKHLYIEEVQLPSLEDHMADFQPGGSFMEIQVPTGKLKPLEITFKFKGLDPHTMAHFGLGTGTRKQFYIYAAIVDEMTGDNKNLSAIAEGRLSKVENDAFKAGELIGQDYSITSILFYQLLFDENELYRFRFNPPERVVNGVDHYAQIRSALRLPGV